MKWYLATAALGSALLATAGCASLGTPKAQLFAPSTRHQSVSIICRWDPPGTSGVQLASHLSGLADGGPAAPSQNTAASGRRTTLALRYPHPAGRVGYARAEVIVEGGRSTKSPRELPAWIESMRRLANENLPGIVLAGGIEEAMGLDLPVSELEQILERLKGSPSGVVTAGGSAEGVLTATLDGQTLPIAADQMSELKRLAAQVRRDGMLISQPVLPSGAELAGGVIAVPGPRSASAVVPAQFVTRGLERLPRVD